MILCELQGLADQNRSQSIETIIICDGGTEGIVVWEGIKEGFCNSIGAQ